MPRFPLHNLAAGALVAALIPASAVAQSADSATQDSSRAAKLVGVQIIGSRPGALARIPGSAAVITQQQILLQQPFSGNDVLRTVAGISIQEEEGAGLRANIGIRGLDPDRSRTVLVLEDGVPVSLAPYGEPEMYYTPPLDRMDRIEIVKGSGSILYGPQTIGGVVNYLTAEAPTSPHARAWLSGGSGGSLVAKADFGGTWGRFRGTSGFLRRKADNLNGLFFDVTDVTAKTGLRVGRSDFGAKVSVYDERSNSTYVGLTDSMYRAGFAGHPAPGDLLRLARNAVTATHEYAFARGTTIRTNLYAYETTRDWRRQDYTYSAGGNSIVFRNSTGNRNRSFNVAGVEPRLTSHWQIGSLASQVELGIRLHTEAARDRFIVGATATADSGILRDDELRTGRAVAGFLQNRFFVSDELQIIPGMRVESFSYDRHVLRARVRRLTAAGMTNNPEDVDIRSADAALGLIPGLGAAWSPREAITVFAGAHAGFAPPRTKDALVYENPLLSPAEQVPNPVSLDLDAERSWNYELGTRVRPNGFTSFEATLFYLDFSNQIIEPSASSGSVAQAALANQGRTRHAGAEAAFSFDAGAALGAAYSVVIAGAGTFNDAVFSAERWMVRDGTPVDIRGNRLPYAPRLTANGSITLSHPRGPQLRLDATRIGDRFSDNFETRESAANGRTGLIPAHTLLDLAASYELPGTGGLAIRAGIRNLTDARYIASRRPEGIKPGLPRLITVGASWGY